MNSSLSKIQDVLRRTVDASAQVEEVSGKVALSPFLLGSFNLYRASALGDSVLFAEDTLGDEGGSKRLVALERALGEPVAVFLPQASASQKRSMMAKRRGFVTARGDMYLPQLAIALKESAARRVATARSFTPAQQQAFLYCLLTDGPLTQDGLRDLTGMSAAGASRALSSLADEGLIDYEVGGKTGRKRLYFVPDAAELIRRGRRLFGDPVKSEETVDASIASGFPDSGFTALARRSELVAPERREVAAGPGVRLSAEEQGAQILDVEELDAREPVVEESDLGSVCLVQRLAYDPRPFANDGMVDPFTMLMTVDNKDGDERVSIALREALKEHAWYTD